MPSLLKIKLLFFSILSWFFLSAQVSPSRHFTVKDGLPSNAVYCIFKDSKGLIWIGTDAGLVQYNGFKFKVLTKKNGLAGNFIRDIKEDKKGNIWIACYGNGITKLNSNSIRNFYEKDGLVNSEIRRFYFDKKGVLWIGTERGLSVWNGRRFINFQTNSFNRYNRFQVMQFWEEKGQIYFLSRTHGYYKAKIVNGKLKCTHFGKLYSQVFFTRIGGKKLFSMHDGLLLDKSADHFPIDSLKCKKVSSCIVWDILHSKSGILLASNGVYRDLGGLLKWKDNSVQNISSRYGIQSNQVWSFYHDIQSHKIWVATLDEGVYILDEFPALKKYNVTHFMDFDATDNITTCLSKRSLIIKDNSGKSMLLNDSDFIDYAEKVKFSNLIPNETTVRMRYNWNRSIINPGFELRHVQLVNRKIYVSTSNGLFILSESGKFQSYFKTEMDHFAVRANDYSFFWPNGFFCTIKTLQDNKWFINCPQPNSYHEPKDILKIAHLQNYNLFASYSKGLFMLPDDQLKAQRLQLSGLSEFHLKDLCTDGKDCFYVLNDNNELVAYQLKNGHSILLEKINTKLFIGETLLRIAHDGKHLFVLTNRGLNVCIGKKVIFRDSEQGFSFRQIKCFKTVRDKLIIGTEQGYFEWDIPMLVRTASSFNQLSLNAPGSHRNSIPILSYPYDQEAIQLRFNKVCLYHSKKINYEYSLDKKNWAAFNGTSLNLNQLASGKYHLYVRQTDSFSGNISIFFLAKIIKAQPFWKELWFLLLAVFSFVMILYLSFQWRMWQWKKRELQKSELLNRISASKLEALQSQMNPHFIFNSLTAIHSFIIKSDVDNALLYMDKFSKLTRQTLEFSSCPLITLIDELEYLYNFIALENMRFGNKVQVHFDAGELDSRKIKIPPLLVQPLVENAFEHGFSNRQRNYHLYIKFSVNSGNLMATVTDDGEGFTSNENADSKAINIIRERLFLIQPDLRELFTLTREGHLTIAQFSVPLILE